MITTRLIAACIFSVCTALGAEDLPWKPTAACPLSKHSHEGLHPKALEALAQIDISHRITQTINLSNAGANYHGPDQRIDGKEVTSAVDISVRCLGTAEIKRLISTLASKGFAAWYRQDGQDDWKGPAHIHAVWAEEPLKRQLRSQIASWLAGRNGLVGDANYQFWQPTSGEVRSISQRYKASKGQDAK